MWDQYAIHEFLMTGREVAISDSASTVFSDSTQGARQT